MGFLSEWTAGLANQAANEAAQKELSLQEQKRKALEEEMAQMKLKYNPIEEGVDASGKPTFNLRKELQLQGPEQYIQSERDRLAQEQAQRMDQTQAQSQQAEAQQRANLATRGGLRGQNAALLSRFNMRDAMLANQRVGADTANKRAELESRGYDLGRQIQNQNVQNLFGSVAGVNSFELEKFKKLKDVEASKNQADATRASGGGGGKK